MSSCPPPECLPIIPNLEKLVKQDETISSSSTVTPVTVSKRKYTTILIYQVSAPPSQKNLYPFVPLKLTPPKYVYVLGGYQL